MGRRRFPSIVVVAVAGALVLGACGSGDSSSGPTTTPRSPVEKAQAKVDRATSDLEAADSAFKASSKAFCGDAKDVITVVDRYGQVLHRERVTVGEVDQAAVDLTSARKDAGGSADQALNDHAAVLEADASLKAAEGDLAAAQAVANGETTTTVVAESTTTTPLVATKTIDRVTTTEEALKAATEVITPDTTVVEAGVRLSSAAFAVEVSWLRLFADAGCLSDTDQEKAIAAVTDYTTALQQSLTTAGYYQGPIDGVYGASTVEAVEALQQAAQLPVTGLLDPATSRALDAAVAQKAGSAVAGVSARTAGIQGGLKALGYWDGPVDGKPSAALTTAVTQLQTDLGLEPTGIVDSATLDAIARTVADAKEPTTTTTEPATTETTVPATTTAPDTTTTPN